MTCQRLRVTHPYTAASTRTAPAFTVTIDGVRWVSSDERRFVVDVPQGRHRIEVFQDSYARFSREIEIRRGDTVPLTISLVRPT